ncbi:GNAT family N-acetyltransferase [Rugamonas sp.]|uniref:GNAT family N-acetyltransferase n=1 Tax=Rugamonas sp. TaxID=1926287 RepID=UPI0025CDC2D6|nr:GNAT family N-acetyltransferase [Rugamonas sp.]
MLPASEFARHADMWRAFNAQTTASALLEPEFVQALLDAFGSGREWLAVCARDGRTLAMALVLPRRGGAWGTFQPSQAPVSMWMHRAEEPLDALLAGLTRKLPGMQLMLSLSQRDPRLEPRPPDSALTRTLDYINTAHIDIAGSFDDYWAARGKNLRSNLKKQRNKLARDGVAARMQIDRAPELMAQAVADFGRLESAGWKQQLGTAVHPDNEQGRFYRTMLEAYARRGAAAVYRYWFDDRLMAMDLCIEGHGCLIVLKTTYDEAGANGLSPTLLMREECCRELFELGRHQRLEFYGKVMEWHTRWTDDVRTMYHVNHYRWPGLLALHTLANRRAASRAAATPPAATPAPHTDSLSTE